MDIKPGLPATDNFQHRPPWRPLVVETARRVLDYTGGTLVMPMTVLVERYWREISSGLAQHDIPVRHFVLHADQNTLRARIAGDTVLGPNSPFRLQYLGPYTEAAGIPHPRLRGLLVAHAHYAAPSVAAHSSPRSASVASLSPVSFAGRVLLLDRNTPSLTSVPSGRASTWLLGTVPDPVRALLRQGCNALLEGVHGRRDRSAGRVAGLLLVLYAQRPAAICQLTTAATARATAMRVLPIPGGPSRAALALAQAERAIRSGRWTWRASARPAGAVGLRSDVVQEPGGEGAEGASGGTAQGGAGQGEALAAVQAGA